MGRTITRHRQTLELDEGGLRCPSSEQRDSVHSVVLVFKPGVTITTGLHWHEDKTEYLQVVQGHALITLGDVTAVFGPQDGIVTVPRFMIHQYGRADETERGAESREKELLVKEWTDPADGDKEVFFRNVISSILDRQEGVLGSIHLVLKLFTIMRAHDNYPVFWKGPVFWGDGIGLLGRRIVTSCVLNVMGLVGWALGCKGTYEEYTP